MTIKIEKIISARRAITAASSAFATNGGITLTQYIILSAIAKAKGAMSHSDIIDATGVDRSTMSIVIRNLKDAGYVSVTRSMTDGRGRDVDITASGRAALADAKRAAQSAEKAVKKIIG